MEVAHVSPLWLAAVLATTALAWCGLIALVVHLQQSTCTSSKLGWTAALAERAHNFMELRASPPRRVKPLSSVEVLHLVHPDPFPRTLAAGAPASGSAGLASTTSIVFMGDARVGKSELIDALDARF